MERLSRLDAFGETSSSGQLEQMGEALSSTVTLANSLPRLHLDGFAVDDTLLRQVRDSISAFSLNSPAMETMRELAKNLDRNKFEISEKLLRQVRDSFSAAWINSSAMESIRELAKNSFDLEKALQANRREFLLGAELAEAATRSLRDSTLAFSTNLAQSWRSWEDLASRCEIESARLVGLQFVDSLRAIQCETLGVVDLLQKVHLQADNIASTALENARAFQDLQLTRLEEASSSVLSAAHFADLRIAADYVLGYNHFVRLATPISNPAGARPLQYVEHFSECEAIGPRLERELEQLDPHLAELRRQGWANVAKEEPASLRLGAHAIREVFAEVLRELAPDEQVMTSAVWQHRKDPTLPRPTRQMRMEFLLGSEPKKLAAVTQFDKGLQKAHKFAHTFPDESELVRAYLSEVEICTYLLLFYGRHG